jgi:hypothetical protein
MESTIMSPKKMPAEIPVPQQPPDIQPSVAPEEYPQPPYTQPEIAPEEPSKNPDFPSQPEQPGIAPEKPSPPEPAPLPA